MTMKRPEKKSETLEVRIPHSKKQAFMEACEHQGITASEAVRTFIDAYLKRSRRAKLNEIAKDIAMKLFDHPIKATSSVTALTLGALALTAGPVVADVEDRDAQPIVAPMVTYPADMAEQGIGADCEAHFDVSVDGLPEDISATCTHPGFVDETLESAATLRFEPKVENGQAVRRSGVVYPIVFAIGREDASVEEQFAMFDSNDDGLISAADGRPGALDGLIGELDLDGDGKIDMDEFAAGT